MRDVSRRVLSFRTNYTMKKRLQNVVKSQVAHARKCTYSRTLFTPVATLIICTMQSTYKLFMSLDPQMGMGFQPFWS